MDENQLEVVEQTTVTLPFLDEEVLLSTWQMEECIYLYMQSDRRSVFALILTFAVGED